MPTICGTPVNQIDATAPAGSQTNPEPRWTGRATTNGHATTGPILGYSHTNAYQGAQFPLVPHLGNSVRTRRAHPGPSVSSYR